MTGPESERTAPEVAVILAAGLGTRLPSKAKTPKPLTMVLGLTLAERIVCTLRAVDIRRFIVTLGHETATVRAHFADIARRRGVTIEFVEAKNWKLGNGASALAAKDHTGAAPFFLVMSDHLFDPGIARALIGDAPAPSETCLAVDRDRDAIFDPSDVTRVRTVNGHITRIDKSLQEWDAADTGVMLCTAGLFDGLERAAADGRHGLSDGLRELAREGRVRTVDVTGQPWIDVDTPEALREAERRMLRGLASKSSDGPVSRHLNRPLSRRLTRLLVRLPITPNQVSVASWALCCLAAALFAIGGYPALAAGGIVAHVASIIDGCDGEIARLKDMQSDFGGLFDSVLDRYADAFLLFGLTWHVFAASGSPVALAVGFAAIVGSFVNTYTSDKFDALMSKRHRGEPYLRLGRDVRLFVIFLGALVNLPLLTLGTIALAMNLEVVRRLILYARNEPGLRYGH